MAAIAVKADRLAKSQFNFNAQSRSAGKNQPAARVDSCGARR
jgi:hypothetical protein